MKAARAAFTFVTLKYMINIKILCVGKLKERFYTEAANEYLKRLSAYCKLEVIDIPEYRLPADPSDTQISIALEKESAIIKSNITSGTYSVVLCIEGREIDSVAFSDMIADCAVRGVSRICFILGGSFGLHDTIKNTANLKLSLSKMTFPHNLARVILLEQLYRGFTIAEGGKYHK